MFWKTDLGKALIVFLVVFVFMLPIFIYLIILNSQRVQTEQVEFISKRTEKHLDSASNIYETWYFATFKFPDDSEREFAIIDGKNIRAYTSWQEGDTGTIYYKQMGDGTGLKGRRFIGFEKDS